VRKILDSLKCRLYFASNAKNVRLKIFSDAQLTTELLFLAVVISLKTGLLLLESLQILHQVVSLLLELLDYKLLDLIASDRGMLDVFVLMISRSLNNKCRFIIPVRLSLIGNVAFEGINELLFDYLLQTFSYLLW
jgi:hypothetical protein